MEPPEPVTACPGSARMAQPDRCWSRTLLRLGCAAALVFFFPVLGLAHAGNVSYSQIEVQDILIRQEIRILVQELLLAVPLDANHDGTLEQQELAAARDILTDYLRRKVEVFSGEVRLPLRVESLDIRVESVVDSDPLPFLFARLVFESQEPLREFRMRCHLLDEVDIQHDNFAKINIGGEVRPFVFTPTNTFVHRGSAGDALAVAPSPWETLYSFGLHGIRHIFTGYDHMLFLIGLLLVAASFGSTVRIVTAFTISHSLALALAAFRVVSVPSRFVEAVIALSIMYVAAENVLSWFPIRRWMVSFSFGLVHGLAFAETLQVLHLPRTQLVTALFSFNVGIEIAQVLIVASAFPVLLAMAKASWRLRAIQGLSFVIFCCGTAWLIQRTIG